MEREGGTAGQKSLQNLVVVSSDRQFRERIHDIIDTNSDFRIATEVKDPLHEIEAATFEHIRKFKPRLIILDMEEEPDLGIDLARYIQQNEPAWEVIAIGPPPTVELMMEVMRAGAIQYFPKPIEESSLRAVLDRVAMKPALPLEDEGGDAGRLWLVTGTKGGTGASTLAGALARSLTNGEGVLYMDLGEGPAVGSLMWRVTSRFHYGDLIKNLHRLDEGVLPSYLETHESGTHIMAGPQNSGATEAISTEQIITLVRFFRKHFDHVVVDLSDPFKPWMGRLVQAADATILVSTPDIMSLKRAQVLLEEEKESVNRERLHLVLNRYRKGEDVPTKEVKEQLGVNSIWTTSEDRDAVAKALYSGDPVYRDDSTLGKEWANFMQEALHVDPVFRRDKKSGFFGKLLRK